MPARLMPRFAYFAVVGFALEGLLQLANWKWPDAVPDIVFYPLAALFIAMIVVSLPIALFQWLGQKTQEPVAASAGSPRFDVVSHDQKGGVTAGSIEVDKGRAK